jgi:hypothetical protein
LLGSLLHLSVSSSFPIIIPSRILSRPTAI